VAPERARDLLDADASVGALITRDPDALSYATGRADLRVTPLAWDRTYVLLRPAPSRLAIDDSTLTTDAVRVDARAAEGFACPSIDSAAAPAASAPRVAYDRDDAVAGALAARIVALAPARDRWTALALPAEALARAIAAGREGAYIVAVPGSAPPCAALPWSARPLIVTRAALIERRDAAASLAPGAAP
jgi:hypothetical protein